MTLAIMQPYFMPYLGYWQLINAVDKFIILDNVNFIKQGYINRNTILVGGKASAINIQLNGISSNKLIVEHELNANRIWRNKLLKTITQNYAKAPYFKEVFPLVEQILLFDEINLSRFLLNQFHVVNQYLNINTEIIASASLFDTKALKGEDRILDICKQTQAKTYINAIGGKDLYSVDHFANEKIELKFIKMNEIVYSQFKNEFVTHLSIIDVMMFNSVEEINMMLNKYELV